MELDEYTNKMLAWLAVTVVTILISTFLGVKYPVPAPPAFDSPVALGTTHFTNVQAEDVTVTDDLTVTDAVAVSGDTDLNGNKLDLDSDADTSIEADTDDQIDFELGGADIFVLKDWGASTITTDTMDYLFEIQDSTPVMTDGTNSLAGLNIDMGIGNSTAGTNSVYGILIDNISQDAQNTETAIDIAGTGWDVGLGMGGNKIDLDADDDTSITADTDDQIDIEISGADDFQFTANTFTAQSGSSIALASGAYPLGYGTTGYQAVYGSDDITGTATAAHGLTTVTFAVCTLGQDPDTDAGDAIACTVEISANVVTLKAWEDDWSAAEETDVLVHWLVIGVP
jgi:hypothetical protein